MIVSRLNATPLVVQLPIGAEADFRGVIDLVGRQAMVWSAEAVKGEMYDTIAIPTSHEVSAVREWRDRLFETIAENDDEMMELYLEGDEPSEEQLIAAIRRATIAGKLTPVLCGSAFKNKGVQPMLDAVVRYLPSPIDVGAVQGHAVGKLEKVVERRTRTLRWRRLLQDHERPAPANLRTCGSTPARCAPVPRCSTALRSHRERIGKIYRMHANKREEIDRATVGQIVAVMGLKNTCSPATRSAARGNVVILESMSSSRRSSTWRSSPGPSRIRRSSARRSSVWPRRTRPSRSEPTRRPARRSSPGWAARHPVDRMRREFRVEANVGKPQVAYRETIRRKVDKIDYTHKKQTGGSQYARVQISIEPTGGEGDGGYEFENKVTGGRIPKEYIPSVDAGCQEAMDFGVLPVTRWST